MKYLLLILLLFSSFINFSQTQIGFYTDVDGTYNEGYYDELEYNPKTQLSLRNGLKEFLRVDIIRINSSKNEKGYVQFKGDKIVYKKTNWGNEGKKEIEKIKYENLNAVVLGIDSFFVSNNVLLRNNKETTTEILHFLQQFGDFKFAKYYDFKNSLKKTYLVKTSDNENWLSFPSNKKEFKTMASNHFYHVPYLKRNIENGTLTSDDLESIIKIAQYYHTYENNDYI